VWITPASRVVSTLLRCAQKAVSRAPGAQQAVLVGCSTLWRRPPNTAPPASATLTTRRACSNGWRSAPGATKATSPSPSTRPTTTPASTPTRSTSATVTPTPSATSSASGTDPEPCTPTRTSRPPSPRRTSASRWCSTTASTHPRTRRPRPVRASRGGCGPTPSRRTAAAFTYSPAALSFAVRAFDRAHSSSYPSHHSVTSIATASNGAILASFSSLHSPTSTQLPCSRRRAVTTCAAGSTIHRYPTPIRA
jgi:hypothetical protein